MSILMVVKNCKDKNKIEETIKVYQSDRPFIVPQVIVCEKMVDHMSLYKNNYYKEKIKMFTFLILFYLQQIIIGV